MARRSEGESGRDRAVGQGGVQKRVDRARRTRGDAGAAAVGSSGAFWADACCAAGRLEREQDTCTSGFGTVHSKSDC
ncbi:hypothetical protein A6V37_38210 [Paraburkholderia ginsengiterrae]|uniref:Uncharacterized protein n=1 Tax=Paraburkholderia ginsengiterrae TaxID=1462993 RepID=A0A1A9N7W8_9BURK|nr:hypothetical protein A6V37_38210 [Paraburkholderia ginsengiterrae]